MKQVQIKLKVEGRGRHIGSTYKAASVIPSECSSSSLSSAILEVKIKTKASLSYTLLCCYRSNNHKSPVFDADFFDRLADAVVRCSDSGEQALVLGDFNSKIGDTRGALGRVEEFELLLPEILSSTKINDHGWRLLESHDDFALWQYEGRNGAYTLTCKPPGSLNSDQKGSVIDFVFYSLNLAGQISPGECTLEREVSSHVRLSFELLLPPTPDPDTGSQPIPLTRTMMAFDYSKVSSFGHTEKLVQLASSSEGFTVEQALEAIYGFVGQYTETREVKCGGGRPEKLDPRLQEMRRELRKVERRITKCNYLDLRDALEVQHQRLLRAWLIDQDSVAEEERQEVREKFWEAQKAGNHFLA